MEIEAYIKEAKELYSSISNFLNSEDDFKEEFSTLTKTIENQEIIKSREKFTKFLQLLYCIGDNHQRTANLFNKLCIIFQYLNDIGQFPISDQEIFEIYKRNKRLLLFLFENNFLKLSESLYTQINKKSEFRYYFYSEIKNYIDESSAKLLENEITAKFQLSIDNFEEKCKIGENDSYICTLIRQDSIEDFVIYVNKTNFSLNSTIKPDYFESNSFLIDREPSLLEYACFFGSIQIITFLQLNKVQLVPKIWLYSIHSNNAELVHFLEQNAVIPKDESYKRCLIESIKCHHNEIAEYIQDNFFDEEKEQKNDDQKHKSFGQSVVDYCNYHFYPEDVISMILNPKDFYLFQFINNLSYITIPEVALFGNFSFCKCIALNQIVIPDSVTSIGNHAFCRCISLKQIVIPSSVTSIGDFAFYGCSSLSEIDLPSSVISIGSSIFRGCLSLARVSIPSSIKVINEYSFYECTSLQMIEIPSSVESIDIFAFCGCSSLLKVSIPPSVKSIGHSAFKNCISLKEINIPSSVDSIEDCLFRGCSLLENISIPQAVCKIGNSSFSGCLLLNDITIPSQVKLIGNDCFAYCSSLKVITIPSSMEQIGYKAFYMCKSLKEITFPSSLKNIGSDALYGCSSLTKITIPSSVFSRLHRSFKYGLNLDKINIIKT